MNQTAQSEKGLAAFRELITPPELKSLPALIPLFFLSLAIIPLAGNSSLALIYLAAAVTALYLLSNSVAYVIGMLLPAGLLYLFSGAAILPVLFTALLLGSACGTVLLLACRSPRYYLLWCLAPVLAVGGAFLICGSPHLALAALLPVPMAVCGFLMVRFCTRQSSAIATLAAVLCTVLIAAGLLSMLAAGVLTDNPLVILGEALRASLTTAWQGALAEARAIYAEAGLQVELPLTDEMIEEAAAVLVNLLPGLFIALAVVVSFFVWRTMLNLILNLKMIPRIPLRMAVLEFSPVTAVVYILAFLVDLFGNYSEITLAGTVAANFALILVPALLPLGFASVSPRRGNRRSCLSTLLFLGLIMAIVSSPLTGVSLAALLGAINVLLANFLPRANGGQDAPPQ